MHIGILSVRDQTYHPNERLMAEAAKAGHTITLIHTRDALSAISKDRQTIRISGSDLPDILLPRVGATINDYALAVVRHFALSGSRVVNGYASILMARNKFLGLQRLADHGISVPDTFLAVNSPGFERSVELLGGYPVVAKMPSSRQGDGVMLVENRVTASFLMNNLGDNSKGVLVQEYLEPQGRTDIRVFILGERVLGAMALTPDSTDFRSNIHITGQGEKMSLSPHLSQLAKRASRAFGLEIAGCDIILPKNGVPKVIEVNYSPGFRGFEAATGLNVARRMIQYITTSDKETSCTSLS